jgi:hypothetical protein
MPQTQIACPRCKQPITANVEQLFDVSSDPGAKQRLLSGVSNMAHCPHCGFEGRLATPIVYHDADKELLLTYFPPELGMPVTEQEKLIGPLINQVTNRLPAEKRKAYLFKPVANLTYDSMIETILGKDGITPEMIKAQQERLNLIDRLLAASAPDVRTQLIKENKTLIDEQFFVLFSRLLQAGLGSGQEALAKQMSDLQKQLLTETEVGRRLQESVGERCRRPGRISPGRSCLTWSCRRRTTRGSRHTFRWPATAWTTSSSRTSPRRSTRPLVMRRRSWNNSVRRLWTTSTSWTSSSKPAIRRPKL